MMNTLQTNRLFSLSVGFGIALLALSGCGKSTDNSASETSAPPATVDTHNHPTEGPHHGGLIELGNEEYHAELVHDEAGGSVTIYLLDSAAKSAVPIKTAELTVNLTHDGQAEQFKLTAKPDAGDPSGTSSRFVSTDAELAEELDHEGVKAQLVVSIGGKQFRGEISHDHDHEEHADEEHDH
ncbi:hypothetical protein [Aeoliella sp.]|uniref:hypothetical protein n=1 Tax=Aeoliella sp. TaxID=2795800 RepID=UPI003CCB73E6